MAEQVTIKINVDDRAARDRLADLEARAALIGRGGGGIGSGTSAGVLAGTAYISTAGTKVSLRTSVKPIDKLTRAVTIRSLLTDPAYGDAAARRKRRLAADPGVRVNRLHTVFEMSKNTHLRDIFKGVFMGKLALHEELENAFIDNDLPAVRAIRGKYIDRVVDLRSQQLQGNSWYENVAERAQYQSFKEEGIFHKELRPLTRHSGRPSLIQRTAHTVGSPFANVKSIIKSDFKATPIPFSKASVVSSLKEVAPMVGVITGAMELMALSTKMSEARSSYYKQLMLTGELPDGDIVSMSFSAEVDRISDMVSGLSYNVMYSMPAAILDVGHEFGVRFYEALGGTVDNKERFGMAVDMVGQSMRDSLGLNAEGYAQVRVAQNRWDASFSKMLAQTKATVRKQSNDVAARMQGLGLTGVSRSDLSDSVNLKLLGPAIDKNRATFEGSNPRRTARDVNPYGPDSGSGTASDITQRVILGVTTGGVSEVLRLTLG